MRAVIIYLICLLVYGGDSYAQYESKKAYVGISIGPSVGVGDFGSSDFNLESAGFASTGFDINLNFAYRITSNFGFAAMIMIQSNPFDDKSFLAGFKSQTRYNNGATLNFISVEANSWGMVSFMPGLFASIPIDSRGKIIIEPRGHFGLITAVSPYIKTTFREANRTEYLEQANGVGFGLGYSLGGGMRYNLSDRMALLLNADYLKTNPKFLDVTFTDSRQGTYLISFQQKMEVVNVSVGLAIRFKKDRPPIRIKLERD